MLTRYTSLTTVFGLTAALLAGITANLLVAPAAPAWASTDDFTFDSFHAEYHLGRDAGGNATLRTVETLVAVFPEFDQNRGIIRAIPRTYGEVDLQVSIVSVTDENGRPEPYSISDDGLFTLLRIGDANTYVHGQQTYVIEYSSRNVVRNFADTRADEFYWDVNGTGWAQPFGEVSMRLHLEDGIDAELSGDAACYWGYFGSVDLCEIRRTGDGYEASVSGLLPGQNLTIAVGFDPAAFIDPPIPSEHWTLNLLPLLLLIGSGLMWLGARIHRAVAWRDHPGRGIIVPQYTPPRDAYPALAAHLLGKKKTALPAQLLRFAVARMIHIRENLLVSSDSRWELELIVDPGEVPSDERYLIEHIFNSTKRGKRVLLSARDRKLGDRLATATKDLDKRLTSRGLMTKPPKGRAKIYSSIGGWIVVGLAALWFYAMSAGLDNWLLWVAPWAAFFVWLSTAGAATPPYVMTEKGAELRDHLYGIRDYMQLAEADRIRLLQGPETAERVDVDDRQAVVKLYERLLPYAVIFGIERHWLGELHRDYDTLGDPEWARGASNLWAVNTFSHSIATTRFATTPPPPSSSGSSWSSSGGSSFSGGSSGGGSSGGGGGGGGGGGW